ncbi:MAG: glucose-6-phosphate isomerase [Thermoanaerobaculia bacterium]
MSVEVARERIEREEWIGRIWKKDATVWKSEPEHRDVISNALGWLDVVPVMLGRLDELTSFAAEARSSFDHVVVLGMGGSSLCAEVFRTAFGPRDGWPLLHVLDSTVPAAVRGLEAGLDLERTLFVVVSKSGTTTEPQMFYRYFFDRLRSTRGDRAGENFVAITDPGTKLEEEAERDHFRRTFLNFTDIGGRYSVLSYFGMVPAAISGVDVKSILDSAASARVSCQHSRLEANPGAALGAWMAGNAQEGRDKLTIVTGPTLGSLGLWIEQLIAESTGKEGHGILPIATEPIEGADQYGKDRAFAFVRLADEKEGDLPERIAEIEKEGHPVLRRSLGSLAELGAEFFTWEFATAVAGAVLGIDAFDQPNVQESKDRTRKLLAEFDQTGALAQPPLVAEGRGIRIQSERKPPAAGTSVTDALHQFIEQSGEGDFVAFMEYIAESAERDAIIASMRRDVMRCRKLATTSGYGPRFLHSTGQFHKGGPNEGVFIQLTSDDEELPIPGEKFGFAVLKEAQALGDFAALVAHGRRAIRVHLGGDATAGLKTFAHLLGQAVASNR